MRIAAALLCVAALSPSFAAELRVGVLAPDGADAAVRDWAPLREHLRRALPQHAVRLDTFDLPGLRRAVGDAQVDLFVANSGFYVEMEAAHGASRISTLQASHVASPAQALASAVIVRADRADLHRLGDLRGRALMAVGADAFGGWQLAWRELQRAGIDPAQDLAALRFAGFPMRRIVDAVRAGEVDAGVVRTCLVEALERDGVLKPGELRVLDAPPDDRFPCRRSTPLYPDWPVAVLRGTPPETARAVAVALLTMPPAGDGWRFAVPADYQPVRDLFRELQIGPYAGLREPSALAFVRRHWPWFAIAALLAAAGVAHALRVEVLVLRRTRELRDALDARDRAEADAKAQRERLDHLARLSVLGEMSSMLAHEMNQPLATIGNYAQGVVRRVGSGRLEPAPLLEAGREIGRQAERAGEIMARIRAFARKRAPRREPVDLPDACDAAMRLFGGAASGVRIVAPARARVEADRLQIEQVLLNLLKNARDATRDLPPERRPIDLVVEPAGPSWRVAVRDRGAGLAEAELPRLFEPFYTTKPDGLGLGLAICRSAIEAHGGRLWARPNDPPPGLTVGFDLPRLDDADDERRNER